MLNDLFFFEDSIPPQKNNKDNMPTTEWRHKNGQYIFLLLSFFFSFFLARETHTCLGENSLLLSIHLSVVCFSFFIYLCFLLITHLHNIKIYIYIFLFLEYNIKSLKCSEKVLKMNSTFGAWLADASRMNDSRYWLADHFSGDLFVLTGIYRQIYRCNSFCLFICLTFFFFRSNFNRI